MSRSESDMSGITKVGERSAGILRGGTLSWRVGFRGTKSPGGFRHGNCCGELVFE